MKPVPKVPVVDDEGQVLALVDANRGYTAAQIQEAIKQYSAALAEKGERLKRGADDANLDAGSDDGVDESPSDEEIYITENCDQVRRKIRTFIDNGGMTVKGFLDALNVSTDSYYGFMRQHGKDKGVGSDTYGKAFKFFKKRQAKGLPMPKKRKIATTSKASASSTSIRKANAAAGAPAVSQTLATTVSAATLMIELEGEMEDAVEVYDSCDEIRRKINAHLRKPDVTQAQFLRDLHAQFHGPRKPKSLQSAQLNKFRSQSGPVTGNTSGIYYAAYVFFEKERIAAGRPKSHHREDMEDAWYLEGGVDVERNLNNVGYVVGVGSEIYMNDLGKVRSY